MDKIDLSNATTEEFEQIKHLVVQRLAKRAAAKERPGTEEPQYDRHSSNHSKFTNPVEQ